MERKVCKKTVEGKSWWGKEGKSVKRKKLVKEKTRSRRKVCVLASKHESQYFFLFPLAYNNLSTKNKLLFLVAMILLCVYREGGKKVRKS